MGAGASAQTLNEQQKLMIYERVRDYYDRKSIDDLEEGERRLWLDMKSQYDKVADEVLQTLAPPVRRPSLAGVPAKEVKPQGKNARISIHRGQDVTLLRENELCVGDIVKVRDKDIAGMWFEGLLVGILDENSYEVEFEDEDAPQVVGKDDIVRVKPWSALEIGDTVECLPNGSSMWFHGTVVEVDDAAGTCAVHIEGDAEEEVERKMTLAQIRKISSVRSLATKRWKKAFHAVGAIAKLGPQMTASDLLAEA